MNERIKEIAREAGLLVHNPEGSPTKLAKFAELIVLECINCYSPDDSATDWADKMGRMLEP
jgi:hypothetical protein